MTALVFLGYFLSRQASVNYEDSSVAVGLNHNRGPFPEATHA
jgi:hypothetical protein